MVSVGIVVPVYNGETFIQECLDSIVEQDYDDIECLVMDGESTDRTVEIATGYDSEVTVVSEPDEGQADAIDKGFRRLNTDLVGWLNADDCLLPGAVSAIVEAAQQHPDGVLFHGDLERIDEEGNFLRYTRSVELDEKTLLRQRGRIVQPGSFYRRSAVMACGGVDKSFYLKMDVDLWIRLLGEGKAVRLDRTLAQFRVHDAAKSSESPGRYYFETYRMGFRHERDRLVRSMARRSWIIARHFLRRQLMQWRQ